MWRILIVAPVALAGRGRAPTSSRQSLLPKLLFFDSGFPEHNSISYHYKLLRECSCFLVTFAEQNAANGLVTFTKQIYQ